jgi:Putative beta-barrel porin-2, OmpL-like. bbp2
MNAVGTGRFSMHAKRKFTLRLVVAAWLLCGFPAYSQQSDSTNSEVQQLRELVLKLQSRVEQLERNQPGGAQQPVQQLKDEATTQSQPPKVQAEPEPEAAPVLTEEDRSILGYLRGTTINLAMDGYYEYNFNSPVGRVNLLRAYDVMSNSFSVNQANLVIEHAPDLAANRRAGVRLDFQYGQATETLQGSAVNELRPQAYRPLFQAYGTYVFPVGSGLTVDFGKWASALGLETNYSKDQNNYSRSYYFDFLPFYHMGFRASYNLTPKINVAYWLVNGTQQSEDFNGFKSQAFIFTIKPASTVSWNVNYYVGQEQPDVVPVLNPGFPGRPTQPGLPVTNITPAPNGREHIFDSYVTWAATPKLTFAGEADYVINRVLEHSAPAHVTGGAAYVHYQFAPRIALAARGEYLSDRGGLFSGVTQALKETTLTYDYKVADGFLVRTEWRRDFSNQPFFLTDTAGRLSNQQNTASLGLIWWFGRKQGAW